MKRGWYGRLWIWVVVSLAAHILLLRMVRLPDEHVRKNSARYEVKLLYIEPSAKKPETQIRPEVSKKKPEELKVEKARPEVVEERQEDSAEEKQDEIVSVEEEEGGQKEGRTRLQKPEASEPLDLTPVIEGLRKRIEEELVYPYMARKKGLQGVVRLTVRLDEEGNLLNVSIAESSGYKVLDNAAAALIERIVPYPHDLGTLLSVEVPIRYSLVN
ncbi:MAG TPA: TonB family protein, partial [Spirochaetota bacterium]|nr:TonB family protein [Spirochaetota bacterium]